MVGLIDYQPLTVEGVNMDSDTSENIAQGGEGAEHESSLMGEGDWSDMAEPNEYKSLGFLQMCIERRFHQAVQQRFQEVTRLKPTEYWIHTGVGGSPSMKDEHEAPDYCKKEGAKVMGWSAHGSKCGGLPEHSDAEIRQLLKDTLRKKVARYRGLTHHAFFATEGGKPGDVKIWHLEASAGTEGE
jgi:hypothetical protein